MAVDKSCGPHRGYIFIVYAEAAYPAGASLHSIAQKSYINMIYSSDQGVTWSIPKRISDSTAKFSWSPWISIDDLTGVASVVYYAYEDTSTNTKTHVAYSDPTNLSNWGNILVSSGSQTIRALYSNNITGHSGYYPYWPYSYDGDYIGIASYEGHAYPVWGDSRSGLNQIWIADIKYDAPQLISSTTNQLICSSPTSGGTFLISGKKDYEATDKIRVSTCTSSMISIGSSSENANIKMTAGESIEIGPGFSTYPRSIFTAQIKSIDPCQTPGVVLFKTDESSTDESTNIALSPMKNDFNIKAYPNPTTDGINIDFTNDSYKNVSFTLTNISGRLIRYYKQPQTSSDLISQYIDVSSFAAGLYIVTVDRDGIKYSFKFAKQ